jgi:DNA-binding transcriptional LysR family regulator
VNVSISSSREAARKVEAAEADVGFTFDPPETSALTIAFHHDLVIGALMRPDHPLAGAKTLGLQDCLKYPVALPAEGLSLRTRLDIVRSRIPGASRTYVEANSLRLMRALAREEQVIGFQTLIGCEDDLANGVLIFKPLSDAPLQADRLCVVTSSLRALALAPGMFFDHAVLALRDQLPSFDAK